MKKKINSRLIGIALLAILATAIGITIVYYALFQKQVRHDLKLSAEILVESGWFDETGDGDLESEIPFLPHEIRITWVDSDGKVLYDNDLSAKDLSNHGKRPEIIEAFSTGEGEAVRRSETLDQDTFYYALLLENNTVLRVAMNGHSFLSVFVSVIPILLSVLLGVLFVCVLLSHFLTKQLIFPIEKMVKNVKDGNYVAPYSELEPLAQMMRTQHADILSAAKMRQDFSANVSHELKTPLTAIIGYTELMEHSRIEDNQRQHFLGEIKKNANRLLALISDIIRLSEVDRGGKDFPFENINLTDVIDECKDELEINASQRNVQISFFEEDSPVFGNDEMLKEMVENLVQNAIRYNNPGGEVKVYCKSANGRSLFMVEDNGIGIPLSEQERVFERFYRVDKSRSKQTGGTGLGLAIVKHIAELHDAKIHLESEPGVGTKVIVFF